MKIQFGLLFTKFTGEEPQGCGADNCFRPIKPDDICAVDVETNNTLCEECGKCERYERKSAERRGGKDAPLIKGLDY